MYDVIFVRLKQNLSMVFGKYQLQYTDFRSRLRNFKLLLNISFIKYSVHYFITCAHNILYSLLTYLLTYFVYMPNSDQHYIHFNFYY